MCRHVLLDDKCLAVDIRASVLVCKSRVFCPY